jgi:hypothetical protein
MTLCPSIFVALRLASFPRHELVQWARQWVLYVRRLLHMLRLGSVVTAVSVLMQGVGGNYWPPAGQLMRLIWGRLIPEGQSWHSQSWCLSK